MVFNPIYINLLIDERIIKNLISNPIYLYYI